VLRDEQANAAYERGVKLARRVAGEFESRNPRAIADRAGLKVAYLRWPLVTVGEFDSKNSTINVNLNAIQCAKQDTDRWFSADALLDAIVAHELGHFFALQEGQKSGENDRAMDEFVAHSFTETLLELPFSSQEYEGLWRN
jgi:hypothetical protein